MNYKIGIDEAGRGPLAGPLSVSAVRLSDEFEREFLLGIKDSKKLSQKKREEWASLASEWKRDGKIDFAIVFVSEKIIDSRGMSYALRLGVDSCLARLALRGDEVVYLDGSLRAPERFKQETLIKGDELLPVISLASVLAKVARDKRMLALAKKYPLYGLDVHKGYGTKAHLETLRRYGPSSIHRKSFIHL